ncbi:hypothetical protein [Ralstonia phage RP31]|uniref:Uncharacterized protein n=2 Tax=Ripduovirus RP12 TaxID=2560700 RepID=A0A1L7N0V6_9CAUD|nr:hypothetical protein FDH28_gp125 [Ralstonia phage RP12]BAW19099.1 hypothetical protein [Ralstonia phage RP12]BAW19385.1 hypothetical protein [Ralstonia phage RP31]
MADYTGIATQLRVKKTAPQHLLDFLDYLYWIKEELTDPPPPRNQAQEDLNKAVSTIHSMLVSCSSYFDTWRWRVKEDKGDFWLYESRASTSRPSEKLFIMLLNGIRENLVLEEGDILLRSIFEDGSREAVIYFSNDAFHEGEGFVFDTDHGYVTDSRHPYHHAVSAEEEKSWDAMKRQPDVDFGLPWKYEELRALVSEEKKKRDDSWHPWG